DYTPANEEATAEILALRDKVLADVEMPELDI
ncbi:TPA: large terminase, partial [Escherichia coli]|nr:large terminase [Escherichia coli]